MHPRLVSITAMSDYILRGEFSDGATRYYDAKKLPERWPDFMDLFTIPHLFEQVHLEAGGFGIAWNDYLDLDAIEVWTGGVSDLAALSNA